MAKKKTKEREDPVFVGISDAPLIRRSLLESSKAALIMLRRIETIKDLRGQKRARAEELQAILRNIKSSFVGLKKLLPAVTYAEPVKQVRATEPVPVLKRPSEITQLESELAAIESKLRRLS
jgi:hypothetical protein